MKFVALGVRGSTPAPGADFVRYGGHTSCVAVLGDDDEFPGLVLDAGTGLRSLPRLLGARPFCGHLILTHLHWDHLQGLPFCASVDRADARVALHVPVTSGTEPRALLARAMSPPHFPIAPDGLLGDWSFLALTPGPVDIGKPSAVVTVAPVAHKGGPAFGVRIEMDSTSLVYLPDHALNPQLPEHLRCSAERLAAGTDVLLHDGQFVRGEADIAAAYGHPTIDAVLDFADQCGVGELVLTHHAPTRTDEEIDALASSISCTPAGRAVHFARQDGERVVVPQVVRRAG